ncbi:MULTISPECIES: alpha/beta hydrolase [Paenibacillus]|uniref:alpha/beta hydrolase n=1 Tax=Paenibacillus TaxID=44249 RepID=UPI000B0C80CE|nr:MULTISPECIES: alpha/beta hydrolase [Paenibacillus]
MQLEWLEYVPETDYGRPPLLFIHGAHHGAWCWEEHFLPYFCAKGYPSYAISLRGHAGSEGLDRLHSFKLDDYKEDVLGALQRFKEKPVLIGHSMGGAVVQKVLHEQPAAAVAAVLMATVPPSGMLKDLKRVALFHSKAVKDMTLFNEDADVAVPPQIFFSKRTEPGRLAAWIGKIQPESKKARNELAKPIVPEAFGMDIPLLVLGGRKDWFFSVRTTKNVARTYGTKAVMFRHLCHDMMLSPQWNSVAERMLEFLEPLKRCGRGA